MRSEWDEEENRINKAKDGIDFETVKDLWNDSNRVKIQSSYPIESRGIMIGKIGHKMWTAVFTRRGDAIRIISARRAREKEAELYGQKEDSQKRRRV